MYYIDCDLDDGDNVQSYLPSDFPDPPEKPDQSPDEDEKSE